MDIKALDQQRSSSTSALAKAPFSTYIVAQKGGGKSTMLINLLINQKMYKGIFNDIYLISPTASMDEKFNILKSTNGIVQPNTKLIALLEKLKKKQKILEEDHQHQHSDNENQIKFMDSFNLDLLFEILDEQKYIINNFGKQYSDKILLVFDDCVMDKIFNSKGFMDFIFKSRHFNISVIIISQSYFKLPKSLRLNNTQLILFECSNQKELQTIYNENSCGMSNKEFLSIFNDVMRTPYAFLNFNYQNSKKDRLWYNFTEKIEI